jgi:hypothetical protein
MGACVEQAYKKRITELLIQGGSLTVPEPLTYTCESGSHDYLSVLRYTKTPLPVVVVNGNLGNDFWQETLFTAPGSDNTAYQNDTTQLHISGQEALIQRQGKTLRCRLQVSTGE